MISANFDILGGGLFSKQGSFWYLRGIISASFFANGQCDVTKYAIYTNVAMFSGWVKEVVQKTKREISSTETRKSEKEQTERGSNNNNLLCIYMTLEFEPTRIIKGDEAVKPRYIFKTR